MELNLLAFAEWLRSQPDGAVVGLSGDSFYGPLSVWLEAMTGSRWVLDRPAESFHPYGIYNRSPLPYWATLFHYWIEFHLETYRDVPKALALSVLQEVAEELLEEGFLGMLENGQSGISSRTT